MVFREPDYLWLLIAPALLLALCVWRWVRHRGHAQRLFQSGLRVIFRHSARRAPDTFRPERATSLARAVSASADRAHNAYEADRFLGALGLGPDRAAHAKLVGVPKRRASSLDDTQDDPERTRREGLPARARDCATARSLPRIRTSRWRPTLTVAALPPASLGLRLDSHQHVTQLTKHLTAFWRAAAFDA